MEKESNFCESQKKYTVVLFPDGSWDFFAGEVKDRWKWPHTCRFFLIPAATTIEVFVRWIDEGMPGKELIEI